MNVGISGEYDVSYFNLKDNPFLQSTFLQQWYLSFSWAEPTNTSKDHSTYIETSEHHIISHRASDTMLYSQKPWLSVPHDSLAYLQISQWDSLANLWISQWDGLTYSRISQWDGLVCLRISQWDGVTYLIKLIMEWFNLFSNSAIR